MRQKICILLPWSINNDSRAQRTALSLAKNFDINIFCISKLDENSPSLIEHIPITRIEVGNRSILDRFFLPFYSSSKSLYKILKATIQDYDMVYCHDLPALIAACKLKPKHKFKIAYDVHDLFIETVGQSANRNIMSFSIWLKSKITSNTFQFFIKKIEKKCIKKADLVFTVNESIKLYLELRYKIPCEVVQNYPVKMDIPQKKKLRDKLGISNENKIVIYHGNLGGGRYLLEIIESAKYFNENICLVIMGNGELREALKKKAHSNTYFLSSVPYDTLFEHTSDADLGLVLLEHINYSKKHASANKLFEYMASSVPVLVSNSPELIKVVTPTGNGLIIDNCKPETIALTVNTFFQKDSNNNAKGKLGRKAFENTYNWEIEEEKLLNLFEFKIK